MLSIASQLIRATGTYNRTKIKANNKSICRISSKNDHEMKE
jgi:hypothetical protein